MKKKIWILALLLAVLWAVELFNNLAGHSLSYYGIIPRTWAGLRGIPLAPFLHNGIPHLALNTLPLAVLGGIVMLRGVPAFLGISLTIILTSGAGVWLLGRPAVHAGASGLVYGYFGFLIALGWYERKLYAVLVSLLVVFLYGGMVWGLLPLQSHISWEGHIAGLFAGILAARLFRSPKRH